MFLWKHFSIPGARHFQILVLWTASFCSLHHLNFCFLVLFTIWECHIRLTVTTSCRFWHVWLFDKCKQRQQRHKLVSLERRRALRRRLSKQRKRYKQQQQQHGKHDKKSMKTSHGGKQATFVAMDDAEMEDFAKFDPVTISELTGHADPKSILRYSQNPRNCAAST